MGSAIPSSHLFIHSYEIMRCFTPQVLLPDGGGGGGGGGGGVYFFDASCISYEKIFQAVYTSYRQNYQIKVSEIKQPWLLITAVLLHAVIACFMTS